MPEVDSVCKPNLTLLIGLPGSGKSFLAAQIKQGCPEVLLISTDAIRAKLFGDQSIQGSWGLIQREVQRQFRQSVAEISQGRACFAIYDATNARRRSRREAIVLARAAGFASITGLWLDTPLKLCLERNRQRLHQVPDEAIYRMHRQLLGAPPSLQEEMNTLIRYAGFTQDFSVNSLENFQKSRDEEYGNCPISQARTEPSEA